MATTRKTYRAQVKFSKKGSLPKPRFNRKVREAQEENAQEARRSAKAFAMARIRRSPSVDNRGKRRYFTRLAEGYRAQIIEGGRTFSLRNIFLRGRIFETGARPHRITARNGGRLAFKGTKKYPDKKVIRPYSVMHPGQRGRWPMRDAINTRRVRFQRNILRKINEAARGG